MKIERNVEAERVSAVQATRETSPASSQSSSVSGVPTASVVSLSGNAQNVQKLKDAVDQAPSVRSEKVDALRKKLQNGELDIDTQKLADLLEKVLGDV